MMNRILKLILCMAVLFTAMPSYLHAEVGPTDISGLSYAVYAPSVKANAGEEIVLSVRLKNVNPIATWQADLMLPEGVSIALDEFEDPKVVLSTTRTSMSRHSVTTKAQSNGATRILCSSASNKTFTGTDGETVQITLKIADDMPGGKYAIAFNDEVMAEANETGHKVAQVITVLEIEEDLDALKCDVNGDGKVTIEDVTYIVNYILKKQQK